MTGGEQLWLGIGVLIGLLLGLSLFLGTAHWRSSAWKRERVEMVRELGNYKGMVEHLLIIQEIGARALDLANREVSLLKKGT
jgi:hypothetical protein